MASCDSVNLLANAIDVLRDDYSSKLSTLNYGDILIVTLPNRSGKTYTTMEHLSSKPGKYLYLSDRHEQMEEIGNNSKVKHWYGLSKACENKNDPFIGSLINNNLKANIVCRFCDKKPCAYHKQFKVPDDTIVIAPKEFLPTSYIQEKNDWDTVIFDENIEKSRKIQYTYPEISKDVFIEYGISNKIYKSIGKLIKKPRIISPKYQLKMSSFKNNLFTLIQKIQFKYSGFKPTEDEKALISFLNDLDDTILWIRYAAERGPLKHFYKPYLHYAFDLLEKDIKLIILNTSLKEWIYELLANNYRAELPQPIYHTDYIENKDSLLLDYVHNKRSCSKSSITENGKEFGGTYGPEIFEMIKRAVNYGANKNLKIGLISFKSLLDHLKTQFRDKIELYGHFGGHQGSNKYDDMDMLIIIGTYNINPNGIYLKYFILTEEYLANNPAKFGNKQVINGKQVILSDNEDFNMIKLYKLNEEHEQAIFRSGANIKPDKIVINFALTPEGTEKKLKYREFKNNNQLIAHLSRI